MVSQSADGLSPDSASVLETTEELSGDTLLLGADSEHDPVLSIVIPTMNEEEGIAECIKRVKTVLEETQLTGEIVVRATSLAIYGFERISLRNERMEVESGVIENGR